MIIHHGYANEDMLWLLAIEWMNNTKSVDAKIQLKLFLNNTESDDIKLLLKFLFYEKQKASESERVQQPNEHFF